MQNLFTNLYKKYSYYFTSQLLFFYYHFIFYDVLTHHKMNALPLNGASNSFNITVTLPPKSGTGVGGQGGQEGRIFAMRCTIYLMI